MTGTQHDAWEQILSVARNAGIEHGAELAARYLADGGHAHVVARINPAWVPVAEPAIAESAVPVATDDGGSAAAGGDPQ
jgi:hypothetical protein